MADYDWGSAEQQLRQKAGNWYDPSMLEDLKRNVSYGAGDQVDPNSVNDWVNRIAAKATLRGGNESNSTYTADGQGGYTTGPTGRVNTPTYQAGGNAAGSNNNWMQQYFQQQQAQQAQNQQRANGLFDQLWARAQQGTNINRNDPIIRQQADTYAANLERERRNYISDAAERGGQFANLDTERRIASEHAGQAAAGFEAQLMGRELTARRQEIQDALTQYGALLSADKENALRQQLGLIDAQLRQQGLGITAQGQNQQYQLGLNQNDLTDFQQRNYWDAVRSGLLG